MQNVREIGGKQVGGDHPIYVIAEAGINHNGDMGIAKKLIDSAVQAGCDAVKFQKRTPEVCVPASQRDRLRDTPWGTMTYMDYRYRVEFGVDEYREIDEYCRDRGIAWFASCFDEPSVDFMEQFEPICYKVASASVTDLALLTHLRETNRSIILSSGMSTMDEIKTAVETINEDRIVLLHSTGTYPCPPHELNLRMIPTLQQAFSCPIGYSGHEAGLTTTLAAVALGACVVERHITLDRTMWGSDQAASVEPWGLARLVRDVRVIEQALGDGKKRVYDSELKVLKRLRRA